jgi:acetyl-CoA decarbonylase/synthase, CODH/ACS complex subunit gamma
MALTGLQIYKYLPKTNCKKCGQPTCLAFAMKLAQKQAELSACPFVSDESKQALDSASRPPIQLVTIGKVDHKLLVGNETVMHRHEKTFVHEPGLFVRVKASEPKEASLAVIDRVAAYAIERVGMHLGINGVAVDGTGADATAFADLAQTVATKITGPIILMSADPTAMSAALERVAASAPLVYASTAESAIEMAKLALKHKCPLGVRAPGAGSNGRTGSLDALAETVEQVTALGVSEVVLDPGARGFADSLAALTAIRRLALRKSNRPMGYPIITFPGEGTDSPDEEVLLAAEHIIKYAGLIVLDRFAPEAAYPLLTLRQNIYTDPQKPIQVTPGLYPVGPASSDSPLLITTNFSLTYFSVLGEIEASGVPSWLLVVDSEGLSVLTGWAAGKFDAERIAKSIKDAGIPEKLSHRKVVIPGQIATISGELEDGLSGWEIVVGPRDAADIPGFLSRFATTKAGG